MWFSVCLVVALVSVAKASDNYGEIVVMQAALASHETKINTCEKNSRTLEEKYNSLENKLNSLKKFDKLNDIINKNKNAIQNVENKIENVLTSETLVSLPENVQSIQNNLKNHEENVKGITNKISKLEKSFGKENKKSISNMNTKISESLEDLESKLKKEQKQLMQKYSNDFEKKFDALQKQLATYNAKVLEQANIIKDLSEKYDSTKQQLEELQAGAGEGFGNSFFAQLTELKELIVDSYSHVIHDLLIRMGFDPNNLEETGRQLKNYYNVGYEKCQGFVDQSKVYSSQGVELISVWSGHGFIYYNILVEKIPVWTEGLIEQAQFYGELLHEHGSGYASVIGQKASEFGQLAAEKANEISLEDIKQSSISVAEQAQSNYYTGKDYVRDTFPQVKQVFEGTRTQVTQLGVDDPANVELILDLTIIFSLLLVSYLSLKALCCLCCGSCRRKGKKKKASLSVLKKVEKAKKEIQKAKASAKKKDGEGKGKKGKKMKKKN